MKTAIIGSREIKIKKIDKFISENTSLIISGGVRGIDILAEKYADECGIAKLIFLPEYEKYGKSASHIRNKLIVENADIIIAIWDGISRGTKFSIDYAKSLGKKIKLILIDVMGTEILPGNFGKDCFGNGEHLDKNGETIECCCDECDYLQCCTNEKIFQNCINCLAEYCPRKFL